jgi:hypothetical protein
MVLIFFAPESPWWLTRKGRTVEALHSLKRLGNSTENHEEKVGGQNPPFPSYIFSR